MGAFRKVCRVEQKKKFDISGVKGKVKRETFSGLATGNSPFAKDSDKVDSFWRARESQFLQPEVVRSLGPFEKRESDPVFSRSRAFDGGVGGGVKRAPPSELKSRTSIARCLREALSRGNPRALSRAYAI